VTDPSSSLIHERFDWKWVTIGVLFSVGGNILAYLALRPILDDLLHRQERVLRAAALMAGVAIAIYFLGGLLVGRMSRHRTVKEPAVAGVISVAIVTGLQVFLGMVNIVGLILGAPVCFGVCYLGGILGEKWQEAVLGRRSARGSPGPHA
jgi:predicted MFS family arabinose efflux permease